MKTSGDVRVQWIRENTSLGLEIQPDIFDEFLTNKEYSDLLEVFLKEEANGALILYLEEIFSNGNSNHKIQVCCAYLPPFPQAQLMKHISLHKMQHITLHNTTNILNAKLYTP
jgi:hypothetical protein